MDSKDAIIIVVCEKSGVLLGETIGSMGGQLSGAEVVAIGRGISGLVPGVGIDILDVKEGSSIAVSVGDRILGSGKRLAIVVREGVSFTDGSLDGIATGIASDSRVITTPPCQLISRKRTGMFFGSTVTLGIDMAKRQFSDVFDLEPVPDCDSSRKTLCVFPGCYDFGVEWFKTIHPWDGLYGTGAMALAISLASWLSGGSCSVSNEPVKSAVWSSFEMSKEVWTDYLDKVKVACAMTPPVVSGKIIMLLPECDAKAKAMTEMRLSVSGILAEKRRFEEAVSNNPVFEKFGVKL